MKVISINGIYNKNGNTSYRKLELQYHYLKNNVYSGKIMFNINNWKIELSQKAQHNEQKPTLQCYIMKIKTIQIFAFNVQ